MRHEMLSQRAPFCIGAMAKKGTLSQHFVTHVVPPLVPDPFLRKGVARETINGEHHEAKDPLRGFYMPLCSHTLLERTVT